MFILAQIVNLELIQKSEPGWFTPGNIVSLSVAIIAALAVVYNVWKTGKINTEINNNNNEFKEKIENNNKEIEKEMKISNQEFQEKLNKTNIDANITAKARIEWIRSVRIAASELITAYNMSLIDYKNGSNEFLDKRNKIQLKTNLLIMYFGNDSDYGKGGTKISYNKENSKIFIKNEIKNKMLNLKSNEGKNDLIVDFLNVLKETFDLYIKKSPYMDQSDLQKSENSLMIDIGRNENELIMDEDGKVITPQVQTRVYDEEIKNKLEEELSSIQKDLNFLNIPNELSEELKFLINVLRIYLKIEWTKAKEGK
ncbi:MULTISPECIES: hypothetical protein [Lactobacillales]|uniref:hypothetical protein n=1 Tax=Lactobacillales TaxID=186826 RepID=UPI002FCB75E6